MLGRLLLALALLVARDAAAAFSEVAAEAGLTVTHGWQDPFVLGAIMPIASGIAAGDYDRDGWTDLYVVAGDTGTNALYRNRGDGTFEDAALAAGVAIAGERGSAPVFADVDGDGRLDLLVFGVGAYAGQLSPARAFRNRGDGTFADVTATSGLAALDRDTASAALGDYDRDGDLDLVLAHWGTQTPPGSSQHLWRNDGAGTFSDVSVEAGITAAYETDDRDIKDFSFTPSFVDVNGDGWLDLLVAGDFLTSMVFLNEQDGTFRNATDRSIVSDENGMGAAIADVDGDGLFDWFVSSIWDPNQTSEVFWGITGNRLYRSRGDGTFEDATESSGLREGFWGWGSTFADVDNDGDEDLFHVNGYPEDFPEAFEYHLDPARLFVANGDGTFTERAAELGVADRGQGRGVVALDYDRDGDVDLAISGNREGLRLYRNDGDPGRFLTLALRGRGANTEAIGAQVTVRAAGRTQRRLVRAGSNFASQDPAEVHAGLGTATRADEVRVDWPGGGTTVLTDVDADQHLVVGEPDPALQCAAAVPCARGGGPRATDCLLEWAGIDTPAARIECTEGDPRCDLDPDTTNGRCRIALTPCVNVRDPRMRRCSPTIVQGVQGQGPLGTALAAGVADALGLGRGPFRFAGADVCLSPTAVDVELRAPRGGRRRPGKAAGTLTLVGAGGRSDRDRIRLVCRPPS